VPKATGDHTYVEIWATEVSSTGDENPVLVYIPHEVQLTEEVMDLSEVPFMLAANEQVVECDSVRKQFMSECQQLIALASTCNDMSALQSMQTHVSAALAIARATTQHEPKSRCKSASNKKLRREHDSMKAQL